MPLEDFNKRLSELVRGGGSTARIGRQLRSEGFRVGNDRLRGLVNTLRGRTITAGQLIAIRTGLTRVPTAVEVRFRVTAKYAVARSEFGRDSMTLLSGSVTSTEKLTIPIGQDINRRVTTQAAALVEEEIQQRVRDQGLAQAGDYIEPQITGLVLDVLERTFTTFA